MSDSFTFNAVGLPAPQGSKRHIGKGILVESSKAVSPWRQDVKQAALLALPQGWDASLPMAITVAFRFRRPEGHYRTNGIDLRPKAPEHCVSARAGDVDKLLRSTFDAMTGVVFNDDRQVVTVNASKRYARITELQGALITITAYTS